MTNLFFPALQSSVQEGSSSSDCGLGSGSLMCLFLRPRLKGWRLPGTCSSQGRSQRRKAMQTNLWWHHSHYSSLSQGRSHGQVQCQWGGKVYSAHMRGKAKLPSKGWGSRSYCEELETGAQPIRASQRILTSWSTEVFAHQSGRKWKRFSWAEIRGLKMWEANATVTLMEQCNWGEWRGVVPEGWSKRTLMTANDDDRQESLEDKSKMILTPLVWMSRALGGTDHLKKWS